MADEANDGCGWIGAGAAKFLAAVDECDLLLFDYHDTFGNDGGNSSDRGRSRHSGAWKTGQLRDKRMKGGKQGENQKHSDESVDSEEKERTDPETPDRSSPPLFSVPAAASIGRAAAASSESPARNTRMASRKAEVAEKGHQKRRKT